MRGNVGSDDIGGRAICNYLGESPGKTGFSIKCFEIMNAKDVNLKRRLS